MLPEVLQSEKKEKKWWGKIKKWWKERNNLRKQWKKKEEKCSSVPFASLSSRYFEDYSILKYFNHVQSNNQEFIRSYQLLPFAYVHHLKVCVHSPLSTMQFFSMLLLMSLGESMRNISCFDNIIISFARTNLPTATDKALHIHDRKGDEKCSSSFERQDEFKVSMSNWSWFNISFWA